MSYKSYLIKLLVNNTPKRLTLLAVNKKLKGVAVLTDLELNFDERKMYTQMILAGEQESAEVLLEDIRIVKNEQTHMLIINHVQSNRVWMETLLARALAGRKLKIPDSKADLVCDLFSYEPTELEDS